MKLLVTGGAGFIASHLVERLLDRGDEVVVVDNFDHFYDPAIKRRNISRALADSRYRLVECDIREKTRLSGMLAGFVPDVIFHGAARAGVRPSIEEPFLYEDVNVRGTMNMLEMAREWGVRNFVFSSSSSVYGNNEKVPFSEDDNVDRPISPYAATKKSCEEICFTWHHLYGIPVTALRFFTVYGPRQRPEMAIHKFTRLLYEDKEIPVFGDGSMKRDYTYVADCVDGIVAAIDAGLGFEIINLGESETTSLLELVNMLEMYTGKKAKIKHLPEQPGDVRVTFADITRAKRLLGYKPSTKIREGLREFVDWFNTAAR